MFVPLPLDSAQLPRIPCLDTRPRQHGTRAVQREPLGATGDQDYALNPWNNPAELQEYIRLGERGYVLEHKRIAMQFIHQNPSGAFRLFRRRIFLFSALFHPPKIFDINEKSHGLLYLWIGLLGLLGIALAFFVERKHSQSPQPEHWWIRLLPPGRTTWLCAAIVFLYPFPYYLTFPLDRYRLIIEPILVIFALHLLTGFLAFKAHRPNPPFWRSGDTCRLIR